MVEIVLVVRETRRLKPDYSLVFELPEIPAVGSYISIYRPDVELHTEDVVVRKVWWMLEHPETAISNAAQPKKGKTREVFVECDVAIGPYAQDRWRKMALAAEEMGATVEHFEVSRFSVPEKKPET